MFKSREEIVKAINEDPTKFVDGILNNDEKMPISFKQIMKDLIPFYISSGQKLSVSKTITELIADYFRYYFHDLIEIRVEDFMQRFLLDEDTIVKDDRCTFNVGLFDDEQLFNKTLYRAVIVVESAHLINNISFCIDNVTFANKSIGPTPVALYTLASKDGQYTSQFIFTPVNDGNYKCHKFSHQSLNYSDVYELPSGFSYFTPSVRKEIFEEDDQFKPIDE